MTIGTWADWDQWDAIVRGHDTAIDAFLASIQPPSWHTHAACRGTDVHLWFPRQGDGIPDQARALCQSCPAAAPCLEAAVADPALRGFWSGTTTRERTRLRVTRTRQTA